MGHVSFSLSSLSLTLTHTHAHLSPALPISFALCPSIRGCSAAKRRLQVETDSLHVNQEHDREILKTVKQQSRRFKTVANSTAMWRQIVGESRDRGGGEGGLGGLGAQVSKAVITPCGFTSP
jgi:hypothetical protein